jgi:hypothetical protein
MNDNAMSIESLLETWAQGPSTTEQEKCANAESVIKKALQRSADLVNYDVRVFTQGSYAARTNVRLDSDVDICICRYNQFYYELPNTGPQDPAAYGITPLTVSFSNYKDAVGRALVEYLGHSGVTRGNKAFDIHANNYRIDADVVPAFEHRRYTGFDMMGRPNYSSGIEIWSDDGKKIVNWPQQTYDNGVSKNNRTGRMYKRLIRIVKRLRNHMQNDQVPEATDIASFLIECLAWNAPDYLFSQSTYFAVLRDFLVYVYNATENQTTCNEWGEVNELMYLFRDGIKPWTRLQAHEFLGAAWTYMGYK